MSTDGPSTRKSLISKGFMGWSSEREWVIMVPRDREWSLPEWKMIMKDIDKKILTNALHDACEALHFLENEAEECDEGVLMDQAREMLDALEGHLRVLTPEVYS